MKKETKEKIGIIIILVLAIFGVVSLVSAVSLSMLVEDNVLIDGNDVVSYTVTNEDEIEIVMKNNTVYTVKLGYDNDVVDFTVNSDIHIELERFDTRAFWWDFIISTEPVYPDEYRIGRIIKVPSGD